MGFEAYGRSDPGCVRRENEDKILIDASLGLFVVCDGMGGHRHGEIAAELALAAIRFYVDASRDRFDVTWPFGYSFDLSVDANRIMTAVRLANRQVWRRAEQDLECAGMGTTVAALLLSGQNIIAANAGDSRIYLYRNAELEQISVDDTVIAGMLNAGVITAEEAAAHPMRNVLSQSAGSQEVIQPHITERALEKGDTVLLCSDGLSGVVDEAAIRSVLGGGDPVEGLVDRLMAAALQAGAPDNTSIILLRQL